MPPLLLLDLPIEIVRSICGMLCPHCASITDKADSHRTYHRNRHAGVQSLNNLSKTCKVLRSVAQPLLYHDVAPRRLTQFLRTLVARPDLAALVRAVSNASYVRESFEEDYVSDVEAAALSAGIVMDREETPRWYRCEAVFEILLAYLPHVETAGYTVSYKFDPGEFLVDTSTAPLFSLRHLLLSAPAGLFDLERCQDMLTMAVDLESLRCFGRTLVPDEMPTLRVLRSLSFRESFLGYEDLVTILAACPLLEEFSSDALAWKPEHPNLNSETTAGECLRALKMREMTLRYLDLNLDGSGVYIPRKLIEDGETRLADFDRLETLGVPAGLFDIGPVHGDMKGNKPYEPGKLVRMLPKASLRVLSLHGRFDRYHESLDELAEAVKDGSLPRLRKLELWPVNDDVRATIVSRFGKLGVEVGRSQHRGLPAVPHIALLS